MGTTLSNAAAAAASACLEPASSPADLLETGTEKHSQKKYSPNDFMAICDDLRTARIEMDAEVFSGAQMVTLLLEEIEDFLHSRCGSVKAVLKLLAGRGLAISERTLKDYLYRARKNKGTDKGLAAAKLREAIFEEARKSGLLQEGSARNSACAGQDACKAAASESPAEAEPADGKADVSADDFGTPDNDWLNQAVCQAAEQDEPAKSEAAPGKASSAKKDKLAKKRAKRRARRAR